MFSYTSNLSTARRDLADSNVLLVEEADFYKLVPPSRICYSHAVVCGLLVFDINGKLAFFGDTGDR